MTKKWKELDTHGKVEAVRAIYEPGYSSGAIAYRIDGATKEAIISLYRRCPDAMREMPLGADVRRAMTPEQVAEAKQLYAKGISPARISEIVGVNHMAIRRAVDPRYKTEFSRVERHDYPRMREMYEARASLMDMANEFKVSTDAIRRALSNCNLPSVTSRDNADKGIAPPARTPSRLVEAYRFRINDYPDTLTAALCGDPTPMRRQLMAEGRI